MSRKGWIWILDYLSGTGGIEEQGQSMAVVVIWLPYLVVIRFVYRIPIHFVCGLSTTVGLDYILRPASAIRQPCCDKMQKREGNNEAKGRMLRSQ